MNDLDWLRGYSDGNGEINVNYKIILNEDELLNFIDWLPDLMEGECYYLTLFARKKYHKSAMHDKSQCKRVTATSKEWLYKKIRQMELADGVYTNKNGSPVHNDSLALYVTVNPRSFYKAQINLLKRLVNSVTEGGHVSKVNPATMAMSEIQKAKSRTVYIDFDFDDVAYKDCMVDILNVINENAYDIIDTRGGFHLLVKPDMVVEQYANTWYKKLSEINGCDVSNGSLLPVPGCTQGGYTPTLYLTR